ncbi:hypothetical protein [Sphingopyxis sp.]|uniref:hypothetical protein n=1 Tax=Sphingopyxis sp. TaxID=1908224 RepID=UPI0035AED9C2
MAIERAGRLAVLAAALLAGVQASAGAPPTLAPEIERETIAPEGVAFKPAPADEEGAIDRFAEYAKALARRDFAAAYAMLRLSFQASNPRLEWEMNMRKRAALWADGQIRILRLSWYPDPPGQPAGLYAAFDFRGDRTDGTMDCGYVVVHRADPLSAFTVVRIDTSEVPPELIEDGVPKADVLRQLPCYLGKGIATAF